MTDQAIDATNVACQLTAQGRGAIATVWVRGPSATEIVDRYFQANSGRSLVLTPIQRVVYGVWRHDQGPEDVVVVRPDSQSVEIHSHGGSLASRLILRALSSAGALEVAPDHARQIIHGNPWQAAAVEAAQQALTLQAANRLLLNSDGRLVRAIDELRAMLDSDSPSNELLPRLYALRNTFDFGSRLIHGWNIAIAGSPNVGKSSLINRLVGFSRSIVFDEPGTTRDVVRQVTAIAGWPVHVCDTAGLRPMGDAIERLGIESARLAIQSADLTVWVSDLSQPWSSEDRAATDSTSKLLLIHNKSDFVDIEVPSPPPRGRGLGEGGIVRSERRSALVDNSRPPGLIVSMLKDPNIESILQAIEQRLFGDMPSEDVPFLVHNWQAEVLDKVVRCLTRGERAAARRLLDH